MKNQTKRFFKRVFCVMCCFLMCFSAFSACGGKENSDDGGDDGSGLPAAPDGAVFDAGSAKALASGDYRLDFSEEGGVWVVKLIDTAALSDKKAAATESSVMFESNTPAGVTVMLNKSVLNYSTADFASGYSGVKKQKYGYLCTASVTTDNGSEIKFEDAYYIKEDGSFALSRKTQVVKAAGKDNGFETIYSMEDPNGATTSGGFDFFIPAILYKDSQEMTSGAIGSNLNLSKMYVKETRTGLPLAMLRDKSRNYSVAIAHLESEIDVGGVLGGGKNGDADNDLQYGSVGYSVTEGVSVNFCYPAAEGPTTYDSGSGWKRIFHEMTVGTVQEYKLSIIPANEDTYAKSMTETFKAAFTAEDPDVAEDVDIDQIYDDNIEVFTETYKEFGTGSVVAAGVPWSISLETTEDGGWIAPQGYTFQMGFVGQQTSVGYNLLSAGYANNDQEMIDQGKAILNFWTSNTIMSGALPIVWWDPTDSDSAGQSRGYPSFLRCFVDGMEGILDAYILAYKNGDDDPAVTQWYNAVLKTATWLADNQNEDGSYYRAYETNGSVCTREVEQQTYQGTSKLNTPIAVRFLVRMYELTGGQNFYDAAVAAAEYSYNNLYHGLEKYVGGTPDNPNTVDKEAAVYAMYCFNAAYELTGEEKYLEAAEHAAVSAISWVYCYDFKVPSSSTDSDINCFAEGGVSGFSLIATGHSGADNYSSVMYYEFFKLYLQTGDEFYLKASLFLQQNTKLSSDYNGKMGYAFRAIGPEATNVSDFSFATVGVWLPWLGVVNIQPIGYMRLTFGNADISDLLATDTATLQSQLKAYGSDGKVD